LQLSHFTVIVATSAVPIRSVKLLESPQLTFV